MRKVFQNIVCAFSSVIFFVWVYIDAFIRLIKSAPLTHTHTHTSSRTANKKNPSQQHPQPLNEWKNGYEKNVEFSGDMKKRTKDKPTKDKSFRWKVCLFLPYFSSLDV